MGDLRLELGVLAAHPAHLHVDLLPRLQGQGWGRRVVEAVLHESGYLDWLEAERGLAFTDYDNLHRWSIDDLEGFWGSIWDFFGVRASSPYERVLGARTMPGAEWFPGAQLSYAEHVLVDVLRSLGEYDQAARYGAAVQRYQNQEQTP